MTMTAEQTEIQQLRKEVARLQKALAERDQPPLLQLITDDIASLRQNFEFISDMARFAEDLFPRKR
jgi:hypothetical protein